jgi:predicted ester cyclase
MPNNRATVDRALAAWNSGDLDGYLSIYAPEIELHGYSPEPMRHDEVVAFYRMITDAFPSSLLEFHDVLEDGEFITIRFTMSGTHDGPFMGIEQTGTSIALPGITILRFSEGRCVERWSQADMLGLLVQLGAVPAPA